MHLYPLSHMNSPHYCAFCYYFLPPRLLRERSSCALSFKTLSGVIFMDDTCPVGWETSSCMVLKA